MRVTPLEQPLLLRQPLLRADAGQLHGEIAQALVGPNQREAVVSGRLDQVARGAGVVEGGDRLLHLALFMAQQETRPALRIEIVEQGLMTTGLREAPGEVHRHGRFPDSTLHAVDGDDGHVRFPPA